MIFIEFEQKVLVQCFFIYRSPVVPTQFPFEFLLLDEAPIVSRRYMHLLEIRWNMNLTKFRKRSFETIIKARLISKLLFFTSHQKSTHNNSREMLDFF